MKKLIALLLMGAFLFAVAGCKEKKEPSPGTKTETETNTKTTEETPK
jgi:predicted small lipoprotein YifL